MSNTWQPIKSRLQHKILTASIAQEIEEDGKRRTPMKKQRERRKGEEGRSLTNTFNEASVSCLEDDDECMVYVLYSRLGILGQDYAERHYTSMERNRHRSQIFQLFFNLF